jgi:hypothetical protein
LISFLHSHFPFAGLLKFVFVYFTNMAVLCYSLTIICCCQVQNYIYWIISTENDHRHHHKFIIYEKRLRKEGNMLGLPIKQNLCHFSVRFDTSTSLSSLQRSIWSLHISCICSIWKILHFYSSLSLNPSKSAFFHVLTLSLPSCCLLFINSAHAEDGFRGVSPKVYWSEGPLVRRFVSPKVH